MVEFRATHVVEVDLKDTEFADFSQIYWEAVLLSSGSVRVFGSNKASLSRACVLSKTSACSRSARGRSSGRRKPSSSPKAARSMMLRSFNRRSTLHGASMTGNRSLPSARACVISAKQTGDERRRKCSGSSFVGIVADALAAVALAALCLVLGDRGTDERYG